MVSFLPLDLTNPDSIEIVLSHIDYTMQYGEDEEPKEVSDSANSFIGYHFSLVWWPRHLLFTATMLCYFDIIFLTMLLLSPS